MTKSFRKIIVATLLCVATIRALCAVGVIDVTPISENIFRVSKVSEDADNRSAAVVLLPDSSKKIEVFDDGMKRILRGDGITAVIDSKTRRVEFYNAQGKLLFTDISVENGNVSEVSLLMGGDESERGYFYGGGERGHSLILKNDSLSMYNRQNYGYTEGDSRISQMGISVPLLINDKGYGLFFDSHAKGVVTLGDTVVYKAQSRRPLTYYVMSGRNHSDLFDESFAEKMGISPDTSSLAGVVSQYTRLTGRQPLPPVWTLGYITSKYGYHNQDEVYGVVDSLKRDGYPVDGLVLDLYWYGVETDMGRLAWDSVKWRDHRKMLDDLKRQGVNTVLIHQPYINKIGALDNYNLLSRYGMLVKDSLGNTHDVTTWVGDAGMFDMSNPDTRKWLWERLRDLTAEGVAGWWGDLGEPEVHPSTIRHANGMTAEEYHNQYGNDWSELIYNGMRRDFPDQRPMLMMRGGTAGLQRNSVFTWTTDVSRSWKGFQPQVKLMLSAGLSGLGYMSSDLGGFAVDASTPADSELYARWLQMGAFTPMMRTHAQLGPEPYHFPDVAEISHTYINMRYKWLPYNYSLAFENALYGWPMARPLNFRTGVAGSELADVSNEYLWGDNVLVAPVMQKGSISRSVVFPEGEWVNWWDTKQKIKGGRTAYIYAPLNQLPLFIKSGSFIPQAVGKMNNVGDYDPSNLEIMYFPSEHPSSYRLYQDDMKSPTSIEDGNFECILFQGQSSCDKITISMENLGGYAGMPSRRAVLFRIINCGSMPESVRLYSKNGVLNIGTPSSVVTPQLLRRYASESEMGQYGYSYDTDKDILTIRFPWGYSPTHIEIVDPAD